ncbi:hypothetical protein [Roseivirga misakiensis]|uniref:Carboxypeptidase regulatory-like domain-containing protein n=1 Tax=Roseivirga misakiensis TaxID=1563681 RepID=A0A1E5T5D7_9BACT|nr:hypothetical protein [Roseivirga misakiensis]OEK06558.1 hypothetical protein BFP71_02485 [Roseivirga misakiensis]
MKRNTLKYYLTLSLVIFTLAFSSGSLQAQDNEDRLIVQLSALVMNADSTRTIPFVHIFNQRGRGDNTDFRGWINHAFFAGDSLTISAVGFKNQRVKVPEDIGDQWTVIFALESEARELDPVEVNPFPSEELFKEAILAMNLTDDQENVMSNFAPEVIQELIRSTPLTASPSANYRYMLNQQFNNLQQRAGPRANPLLNPFAWGQFINSLKKKKKK